MAQAVIRRPLIAEAGVRSRVSPCGKRSGTGTGFFLRVIELSPLTVIPRVLHSHLQLHVALNPYRTNVENRVSS